MAKKYAGMKNLLFLVHRIPYPPNKGDKIRSYHFLKGLARDYNIHLVTFIDDSHDWQYVDKVEDLTVASLFVNLNAKFAKIKSLMGFLSNKALSLPYYQSNKVQSWVDKVIAEKDIDKVFIYSSAMAQYVDKYQNLDITIDFVDVDSDKWLQYSQKASWPMNWIYRREAKLLLEYDKRLARHSQMSVFVSETEAMLFQGLTDSRIEQIGYVNNGVDTVFFDPDMQLETPYSHEKVIVFTGAMDYWANIDAVIWFVDKVFPLIRQQCSKACFYIVGSKPTKDILQLATIEGVFVTGRVDDIRPYLLFADVVVAPLLIARGIQNKILEAMAMSKRIVATPQAIEGIRITNQEVTIMEEISEFAEQVVMDLNHTQGGHCAESNRDFVAKNYSWSASLKRLTQIIESD